MLIDLSWNQMVNYLVISWCDVKGTLTRCYGQTLSRQGGDGGETGGYSVLCPCLLLAPFLFNKAVLRLPFSRTY